MQFKRLLTLFVAGMAVLLLVFPVHAEEKGPSKGHSMEKRCPYSKVQKPEGTRADDGGPMGFYRDGGWYSPPSSQHRAAERIKTPLTGEQAEIIVENMLRYRNNPNLQTGDVEEEDEFFVVRVETRDGSLVDKIQVHKMTGWVRSAYDVDSE